MFSIKAEGLPQNTIDASYLQVRNKVNEAKRNFERAKELVEDKIIAERDYLDIKLIYDNALIEMNMLSKNNSSSSQHSTSPISGYIKSILVNEGQYVTSGTPLAVISKNRKVILQANVSQKYISILPTISSANFKIQGSPAMFNTQDLHGRVVSYGKIATGGYVPLLFELDYDLSLMPGSAVEFFLKSKSNSNTIIIPETSLIEEQGAYYVYIQTGGESFQKREVKIGESDGMNVQVFSGIKEGERVVTKGAYQIKLSSASGTMPAHGHEH
jgi:cobalt-zinc-cadmium efflux system membrane fusion protein